MIGDLRAGGDFDTFESKKKRSEKFVWLFGRPIWPVVYGLKERSSGRVPKKSSQIKFMKTQNNQGNAQKKYHRK